MSLLDTLTERYHTSEAGHLLYECVRCGQSTSAATAYIVCPECGGKLERIPLMDYSNPQFIIPSFI
jgi:hypothetical protein